MSETPMLPMSDRFRRPFVATLAALQAGRVATVSAFLTVGFCRWEKPTVNHRTIDRGYR